MPNYKYKVVFSDGKIGRGTIMATSKAHAIESLKKDNNQPVKIKRLRDSSQRYKKLDYNKIARQAKKQQLEAIRKNNSEKRKKKTNDEKKKMALKDLAKIEVHPFQMITTEDIIIFVNNLYILKKARFNNVQALQAIYDGTENTKFKDIIEDILIGVQAGERMYKVMEAYPKVFKPMFINFIRVGEETGTLDDALLYARDYIENSTKLQKKIRNTVIPKVLQFFAIMIMMFVAVIYGVPILEDVYEMFNSSTQVPEATMATLHAARWLMDNWWWIVIAIGAVIAGFLVYRATPRGRYAIDKFMVTNKLFGPLMLNLTVSKFFRAMLLNLKNGMRIQESLEISKNVTSNYYFLSAVEAGKVNALSGESWIEPFIQNKLFNPMTAEMITIGMQTDLAEMMEKVNEYIEMRIEESLQLFIKLLPNVTYSFVGVALIAFVIVVVVPLVNVYMGSFIEMPAR